MIPRPPYPRVPEDHEANHSVADWPSLNGPSGGRTTEVAQICICDLGVTLTWVKISVEPTQYFAISGFSHRLLFYVTSILAVATGIDDGSADCLMFARIRLTKLPPPPTQNTGKN